MFGTTPHSTHPGVASGRALLAPKSAVYNTRRDELRSSGAIARIAKPRETEQHHRSCGEVGDSGTSGNFGESERKAEVLLLV